MPWEFSLKFKNWSLHILDKKNICLQGDTEEEYMNNIKAIADLLLKQRFIVCDEKPILMSTQKINFLYLLLMGKTLHILC